MLKYIKWELLALGKKNLKFFIGVLVLYGLVLVVPFNDGNTALNFLYIPYTFTIAIFFAGTFLFGTIRVVSTFSRKTFLLESMIAESPHKILLAKYLLAIILNLFCLLFVILGLMVMFIKMGEIELFANIFKELLEMVTVVEFLKFGTMIAISSITFTSMVTMFFVIAKCLMPNSKGAIVLGVIAWWFGSAIINSVQLAIFETMGFTTRSSFDNDIFFLTNLMAIGFIMIYYFVTVQLIANKLEIYN